MAAYDPCPDCGVRDIDMRDQETKLPIRPAPIEWFGWPCLSCEAKELTEKQLAEEFKDRHGIKVRARPYRRPESAEDDAESDDHDT